MTGTSSLEVLLRSTFYTFQLHRKDKIPFDYANITDVPAYSWSYASILNALGLKYFAAHNNDRAPILVHGRWNEKSPFYWQGPDGNKVLMSYSRQYFRSPSSVGCPRRCPQPANPCRLSFRLTSRPITSPTLSSCLAARLKTPTSHRTSRLS